MPAIDINADIGEGMPWDDELMEIVTSVNVGLGEHAGKWEDSLRTMERARAKGLRVGFHPGFPDRENFGRRMPTAIEEEKWCISVMMQMAEAYRDFKPDYVNPHGALYHFLLTDNGDMAWLAPWLDVYQLPFMGLPDSFHAEIAAEAEVLFIREGFAERGYREGKLIPRGEPGAELTDLDEIVQQALRLATHVDSICIHGDRVGCVEIAFAVRDALVG